MKKPGWILLKVKLLQIQYPEIKHNSPVRLKLWSGFYFRTHTQLVLSERRDSHKGLESLELLIVAVQGQDKEQ